mgnify:CR=1 FL=1
MIYNIFGAISSWLLIDVFVFFQAEDGIRDLVRSRGLGDVYKRQVEKSVYAEAFKSEQYKFPDMSFDLNKFYIGLKIDSFVKSKNINGNIIVACDVKIIYKRNEEYANFGDYMPLIFPVSYTIL